MLEDPSDGLVDQRIGNRIMEAAETSADGEEGVRRVGPIEYFESFYDWIPHRDHRPIHANRALAAEEPVARRALDLMRRHGRFNEEREEREPSS